MLGAIGHDLRTPLTALRGAPRIRARGAGSRPHDRPSIDDMRQMLDDILFLARIGRDREPPQKVDLASLAEARHRRFRGYRRARDRAGHAAHHRQCAPAQRAPGAQQSHRQLPSNMATARTSRCASRMAAPSWRSRTGVPASIPIASRKCFSPSLAWKSRATATTGGAGLGLAIVRAIASSEAGRFTLVNRPEGGLSAELSLPLAR